MKNIKTYLSILAVILLVYFMPKSCGDKNPTMVETKSDTVYIEKIIKIPAISEEFEDKSPKHKTAVYDKGLIEEYKKLKTENERLKKFEELAQKRSYDSTYKDKSGLVTVNVKSETTGYLDYQKISFNVKEQEIKYLDKVITNTITQKVEPSFIISGGISAQTGVDLLNSKPNVGATIGFKNKSGYNLDVNYNTNENVMVTLKKDIFTFW